MRRTMSATSRHSLPVLVGVVLIGSVTRSRPRLVAATGAVYENAFCSLMKSARTIVFRRSWKRWPEPTTSYVTLVSAPPAEGHWAGNWTVIAADDKAVARVTLTGTHRGEFAGIPPTDKAVEVKLIDIMRFDDAGLICEHWGVADMLSLMQQLGVVPAGPTA